MLNYLHTTIEKLRKWYEPVLRYKKWSLPILGVMGILLAITYLSSSAPPPPVATPVVQPALVPFEYYIGGSGITEANTGNIIIGTHLSGIVKRIAVEIGTTIHKGDPLFVIEDEESKAQLEQAKAQLEQAKVTFANARDQVTRLDRISDKRAISQQEDVEKRAALDIASAGVSAATAYVKTMQTVFDLHTVRSPIDGTVMTMDIRAGEYAVAGNPSVPLVRVGNLHPLYVRVDIDENDAWRFITNAPAMAYVRGNPELKFPLSFVRIEPYIRPKQSLTGNSVERVDTRVLQIIYQFEPGKLPVYSGQQMDVFIEAPSHTSSSTLTHE